MTHTKQVAAIYGAILEIAGHPNGKDERRYFNVLEQLRASQIGTYKVIGVIPSDEALEPVTVPDFGHDYRCQCGNPEPWGVRRYFGIKLVIEGEPDTGLLEEFQIPGEPFRLFISMVHHANDPVHSLELSADSPTSQS